MEQQSIIIGKHNNHRQNYHRKEHVFTHRMEIIIYNKINFRFQQRIRIMQI